MTSNSRLTNSNSRTWFLLSVSLCALLLNVGCGSFTPGLTAQTGTAATTSSLIVTNSTGTVAPSSSITLSASGGVAPYQFSLVSGQGTLTPDSSNDTATYTAPSTTGGVRISVSDAVGNVTTFSLAISNSVTTSSAPPPISCAGTYSITVGSSSTPEILIITESSPGGPGTISGKLGTTSITGNCTQDNLITFTAGSTVYTGYYFYNADNNIDANKISIGGTSDDSGTIENWSTAE